MQRSRCSIQKLEFLHSYDITYTAIQDEYTLHHEFSDSLTKRDTENVKEAVDYIKNRSNPLTTESKDQMKNLVTEEHISTESIQSSLHCLSFGTELYEEYIETRYINKSKKLFLTTPS